VPVPADELSEHLDASLLTAVGGAAGFNAVLASVAPLTPGAVISSSPTSLRRLASSPVGELTVSLQVDNAGLLIGLLLTPSVPTPTTWEAVDSTLRTLAPRVSFAAMRITPSGCRLVHGINPDTARPLGSAFKLYVLGAVAEAVKSGRLSWQTEMPIRAAWKSLPAGVLQDEPDGTRLTPAEYATYMISISDNTATDHLIHKVGREAVQRQFTAFGNTARNAPVLTTREFFALKGWRYPAAASAYVALPPSLRALALPALGRVPLSGIKAWAEPRMIDQVEWSRSPVDMCRAYAGLWAQRDSVVNAALTVNDGGIALPAAEFPVVWFKGGSEPGVLTLNYLARAADGDLVTASVMLSDTRSPLNEAVVAPQALAALRGALQLAAEG
jgi:hypothetical protein